MSLESVWDATARQAALVVGVKAAYATRTGGMGATVSLYPDDITDGPVAVIEYTGSTMLAVGGFERVQHTFDIELWVPIGGGSRGNAVAVLAPFFERIVVAFRANAGLFGTATFSNITGASGFDLSTFAEASDKTYLVQRIELQAQEARSVTPAIGPSS